MNLVHPFGQRCTRQIYQVLGYKWRLNAPPADFFIGVRIVFNPLFMKLILLIPVNLMGKVFTTRAFVQPNMNVHMFTKHAGTVSAYGPIDRDRENTCFSAVLNSL